MDLDLALRSFEPRRSRAGDVGSWSGHQPFAYWLVGALRPASIVELGTHYGESYFTFCQAVVDFGVDCRCTAVDTWQGDAHAGAYSNEVFEDVDAHNRAHYAAFSRLLRMTFDEALAEVPDASVDLLHVDGLHTYEAARQDFETWQPKLRPGAVVLFHDIAERRDDFGVWRLWEELTKRHAHFAFEHSHGLGVIRMPGGPPPSDPVLHALFADDAPEARAAALERLALSGRHFEDRARIARLERHNAKLRRRLARARTSRLWIAVGAALAAAALALIWLAR
jgi:predicted O-methyltransferase YrrM